MEHAIGKVNFLRRGIILISIGLFILVVGVALYLELNTGTRFLMIVLGFSTPFFFIGSLLLRWHYANRKRKIQKPSSRAHARRCDNPKQLEQTTKELADLNDRYMKIFFKPKKLNISSPQGFSPCSRPPTSDQASYSL